MSEEERDRLWALIETYALSTAMETQAGCSDSGYVSHEEIAAMERDRERVRAEVRSALGFEDVDF